MALKVLMLRKKIDDVMKKLEALREAKKALEVREKEIEKSIEEASTDEERKAVEEAAEAYEKDEKENAEAIESLTKEVEGLEKELADAEAAQPGQPAPAAAPAEGRGGNINMSARTKFFGMTVTERAAFFAQETVKEFLERVREFGKSKQERTITGKELLIPTVVLELLRENIGEYSKLYKYVNVRPVAGKARQVVLGAVPEAVWTEMCATLNELSIAFNGVEVDGYKVGGYIAVCNSLLEDSDINLGQEVITMLGASIGFALDKAIIFGTGTKMPQGFFTRLKQTSEPADYPSAARPWVDLHTTNILTIASTAKGVDFFKAFVGDAAAAKGKYSKGGKFWAMNSATHSKITIEGVSINAAGGIVSGLTNQMPVVGGDIVELEFIPDDMIFGGFGDLYLLAERAGTSIEQSEHAQFIEDNTVFKAKARYDGLAVIAEGFVAIGINGETPSDEDIEFAEDTANP